MKKPLCNHSRRCIEKDFDPGLPDQNTSDSIHGNYLISFYHYNLLREIKVYLTLFLLFLGTMYAGNLHAEYLTDRGNYGSRGDGTAFNPIQISNYI
jgi:hypothetical protein